MPILNPNCITGMEVAVGTFHAPKVWESDKGLSIFGPEYIGLDRDTYFEIKKKIVVLRFKISFTEQKC